MVTTPGAEAATGAGRAHALELIGASAPLTFEDWFEASYQGALRLGYALTGSTVVAEELAQDSFVDALKRWPRLSRYDDPNAWLRRVIVNRSVSHHRRERNRSRLLQILRLARPLGHGQPTDSEELWGLVRCLPRRQAEVVALRYIDDLSTDQIAAALQIAPATVRVHLARAHASLASTLDDKGLPDD